MFSDFFKKLREEGDFELEVQFEGGGDSGWIHDQVRQERLIIIRTSIYDGNNVPNVRRLPGWKSTKVHRVSLPLNRQVEKID